MGEEIGRAISTGLVLRDSGLDGAGRPSDGQARCDESSARRRFAEAPVCNGDDVLAVGGEEQVPGIAERLGERPRGRRQFRIERRGAELVEVDAAENRRVRGDGRRHVAIDAGRSVDGAAGDGGGQRNERRRASEVGAVHHGAANAPIIAQNRAGR